MGRPYYERRDCGRVRAVDHEPDRAQVGSDGAPVHQGREPVQGEQRREAGAVERLGASGEIAALMGVSGTASSEKLQASTTVVILKSLDVNHGHHCDL
jgi:hypothetical protein